jgi:hypothetical protein
MVIKMVSVQTDLPGAETEVLLYNQRSGRFWVGLLGENDGRFHALDFERNTRRLPQDTVTHWGHLTTASPEEN